MFAAVLLAALSAAVVATVALAAPGGAARPARRVTAALGGLAATAVGGLVLAVLRVPRGRAVLALGVLAVANVAWLAATRSWNGRGHAAWMSATTAAAAFLGYMLLWTFRAGLGVLGTMGGLLLWALEAAALAMALSYGYEVIDVLARRRWPRRCTDGVEGPAEDLPFVSLHVPAYNEPPEMVIATLESLLALDYPSYEIIMVDDNTKDPAVWGPVAAFCRQSGISFHHLEDWPGFKSGALNYALGVTDPRAEVVGVVDSDYLVDADWLRRTAPLFADPAVAFVQTPQHYRDWEHSSYLRRLFYSYEYFFSVTQASRNERDAAIFGGTMGLIRRSTLEEVGGWDEWCITEDAELSLRLLRRGWSGLHVERPFGRGVMPLTFEALKRQRFRWCFGGVQILRKHWRSLMPWDRSPDNRLSLRQRYDYLAGGVQWFGDLLALAFAGLLVVGALNVATGSGLVFRRMSGALLASRRSSSLSPSHAHSAPSCAAPGARGRTRSARSVSGWR